MRLSAKTALAFAMLAAWAPAAAQAPNSANVFRDCAECPEMVVVPGGTFKMGGKQAESELPIHDVAIRAFAVARTEVTHAQYAAFSEESGRAALGSCFTDLNRDGRWEFVVDKSWKDPGFAVTDASPVTCVNLTDAEAYVGWLSDKTGQRYRLLSEAEYEYAMRGGAVTEYWWGNDKDQMCRYANGPDRDVMKMFPHWTGGAECDDGHDFLAPVASYLPNGFGLYDMTGNAWEWTADCYDPGYGAQPNDGSAYRYPGCTRQVTRGGSWGYAVYDQRSAQRNWKIAPYLRGADVGFRVARAVTPANG
jgi:formylglycine-generating enzyme required for sulfatase activity